MNLAPDPYLPTHGDVRYTVDHYDLELDYKIASNRLDARATLTVRALEATDALRFDLSGLHLDRVKVNGAKPAKVTAKDRSVTIRLARALRVGETASVVIGYSGKPSPVPGAHGPAGWEELTDGVLVASQPYGAPSWFPCNDRADDKATYAISVTTEAEYAVTATGRRLSSTTRAGRTTWVFAEDAPTPTYLVSLGIGRLIETPLAGAGRRVTLVRPRGVPVASSSPLARLPEMLTTLEGWYGPYPFDLFRAVVADEPLEIPLEAQAMAHFGTNHLTPGWDNERLVVHELAHQWFGNAVTAALLADIWLHEGFACYTEWLWSEHRGLGTAAEHATRHWRVLASASQPTALADPGMPNMFDDWVYKRGALTLHALRLTVGDAAFFALCRSWVATYSGQAVSTADFVALAAQHTPLDLRPLFTAWLDDLALPPLPSPQ